MKRPIFTVVFFVLFVLEAFSQSTAGLSITVEENNGRLTIVKCRGFIREVVIPAEINGMPVIAIGDYAFAKRELISVTIPDSVTTIGRGAFTDNQIEELVLSDNITSLGFGAFAYNKLNKVTIGKGITVIPRGCFQINKLRSVELPASLTTI